MNIVIQSYSTTGIRPHNEDAMDLINNLDGSNKNLIPILYTGVFDGHGGGDISKILVDNSKINISKYFCSISSPVATKLSSTKSFNSKYIVPLFTYIQEKLKNYNIQSNTMGSTALISLLYPKSETSDKLNLKVVNLGDSRAVSCNGFNIAQQLTLDHKPHLFCEKDRICQMGGTIEMSDDDDPRINGMSVSRSFGDLDNKFISQLPDVFDYTLTDEKFIILGCDGVWDVLQNQDAVDFVLDKYVNLKSANKRLTELKGKSDNNLAQKLADYAIKKNSLDNISISIIFFVDNMN
jgi:serine/threonine protein phosphatase PrpC